MRRSLNPFQSFVGKEPQSIGGSLPMVQNAAERAIDSERSQVAAQIYVSPALKKIGNDPRYNTKMDNVENIYHPAPERTRVWSEKFFNMLQTGRFE